MAKSRYDELVKPHLPKIEKMIKAGAKQIDMANSLGISKSAFYKYLRTEKELSTLFKTAKAEQAESDIEKVILSMPTKQFFVDRLKELILKDSATVSDVIKVYKVFYPDEDWYRLNEEAKTQIERDRLEKGLDASNVHINIEGSIGYD